MKNKETTQLRLNLVLLQRPAVETLVAAPAALAVARGSSSLNHFFLLPICRCHVN